MNAILKDDPPEIDSAQLKISPALDRIIRHCLEKNPASRFQSARDLAFAITALSGTDSNATAAISSVSLVPPRNRQLLPWLTAAAMAAIALVAVALLLQPHAPAERLEFSIPIQEETSHLAISSDGRMLVFVSPNKSSGANMLCIQQVGSPSVSFLAGTEGASYPFWSPDDNYIGFFADGKLKKIAVSGGAPQIIASATSGRGGTWNRHGVIIFTPQASGTMWKVNSDGSNLTQLDKLFATKVEASNRFPVFLPDDDHFLFLVASFSNTVTSDGIYLTSLSAGGRRLVVTSRSNPGYANGTLFYADEKQVFRSISMNPDSGAASGEPRLVADQIGYQPSTYWAAFAVAANGTVVFNPTVGAVQSRLTWFDRAGKPLDTVGEIGTLANPSLSPDDTRVALDIADAKANSINVWINNLKDSVSSRFTFDSSEDDVAIWSRDASRIAYRCTKTAHTEIFLKEAQGAQPETSILEMGAAGSNTNPSDDIVPTSWTPDNKQILCTLQPGDGGTKLLLASTSGGGVTPFLSTNANASNGQISPDGKWVAYASDESGQWEIYVTAFPSAAGKWQVSRGGGAEPRWRGDGKELFYIGPNSTFTAVRVSAADSFATGNPTPLFRTQLRAQLSSTDLFTYDVTKDGQRFLINRYARPPQIAPVHIILNATSPAPK